MQVATHSKKKGMIAAGISGAVVLLSLVLFLNLTQTSAPVSPSGVAFQGLMRGSNANTSSDTKSETTVPRLEIPNIGVSSAVELVGLEPNGNMAVPTNYEHVGLYKQGPTPGSTGNAVIAGHVNGNTLSDDGVFARLGELEKGDLITYYSDTKDTAFKFRVVSMQEYKLGDFPVKEVFGSSANKNLNLVTCSGEWDAKINTYSHRLVVYTQLVG